MTKGIDPTCSLALLLLMYACKHTRFNVIHMKHMQIRWQRPIPTIPPPVLRSSQLLINELPAGGPTPKNPGKRGTQTPQSTRDPKESRRAPELSYHSLPPSGRLQPGSIRTTHPLPPQCLKPAATAVWYNCLVERAILKWSVKTWRPMRLRCKPLSLTAKRPARGLPFLTPPL